MDMKKLLFILLSVVLIGSIGCGSYRDLSMEVTDAGSTGAVKTTQEPVTTAAPVETKETEDTEEAQPESTASVTEDDVLKNKAEVDKDKQPVGASEDKSDKDKQPVRASEDKSDDKQTDGDKSPETQKSTEQPKETKSEPESEKQPEPEKNFKQEEKQETKLEAEPQAVSYSPDRVVSLAISKCQAGGMVTTEQNLMNNLNAGKISQAEYEEYYPLDGLENSYYSVFVNIDLNKAATTSGRTLGSEEEIAQYIADMLLLESDSVFNIRYTGTTKTSGETFYEFRCYR